MLRVVLTAKDGTSYDLRKGKEYDRFDYGIKDENEGIRCILKATFGPEVALEHIAANYLKKEMTCELYADGPEPLRTMQVIILRYSANMMDEVPTGALFLHPII